MKSIKEIENMGLDELEAVAADESIAVPEGLADRMRSQVEAQKILNELEASGNARKPARWIGVAAAAVILLIWAGFGMADLRNRPKDTFDDPYLAYAELEKAFAAMSDGLQKGFAMAGRSGEIIDKTISVFEE